MCAARSFRALSPSPRSVLFTSPQPRAVLQKSELPAKNARDVPLTPNCRRYLSPDIHDGPRKLEFSQIHECKVSGDITVQTSAESSQRSGENVKDSSQLHPDWTSTLNNCISPSLLNSWESSNSDCPIDFCQKVFTSPLYSPNKKKNFLGRGSFGNVILCKHKSHKFALKIIRKSSCEVGERHFVSIRHPNLVRILKVTEVMDRIFICMEFAGNCNLMHVLYNKTNLTAQKRISFAYQVTSGLHHCHKCHIIHGDVKPANVIVSPLGCCKLGDFGNSIKVHSKTGCPVHVQSPHHLPGTVAYAAPEVLQDKSISTAADIYSLGITLWQIYTSEIPFSGLHPHVIIYKVAKEHKKPEFQVPKTETARLYIDVAISCWRANPNTRPTSQDVLSSIKNVSLMNESVATIMF